jgi:hypothetical protein
MRETWKRGGGNNSLNAESSSLGDQQNETTCASQHPTEELRPGTNDKANPSIKPTFPNAVMP